MSFFDNLFTVAKQALRVGKTEEASYEQSKVINEHILTKNLYIFQIWENRYIISKFTRSFYVTIF